ncbi:hypothetical protein ABZP36_003421 [Zizania latifolia]
MRKPNKEILEHDRKRKEELLLLLLRDALEEQGYTEGEIEERVEEPRTSSAGGLPKPPVPGFDDAGGGSGGGMPKPNKEILEHDRKRQVELRLLLLRDEARKEAEMEAAAAAVAEEEGHGGSRQLPLPGKAENSSYLCFCQREVL